MYIGTEFVTTVCHIHLHGYEIPEIKPRSLKCLVELCTIYSNTVKNVN